MQAQEEPGLKRFKYKHLKELMVIIYRYAPFLIVIFHIKPVFRVGPETSGFPIAPLHNDASQTDLDYRIITHFYGFTQVLLSTISGFIKKGAVRNIQYLDENAGVL